MASLCPNPGEYAFARWTLQRLERIIEGDYNEDAFPLRFDGREHAVTLRELIDNLQDLVDVAFKSVMGIEEYDDDDAQYLEAKSLFINEDGIPYGAVMYGLFLNLYYANVFRVHPTLHHADGAQIENVNIHGLHHKMTEYIRMDDYNRRYGVVQVPCSKMMLSNFTLKCFLCYFCLRFSSMLAHGMVTVPSVRL